MSVDSRATEEVFGQVRRVPSGTRDDLSGTEGVPRDARGENADRIPGAAEAAIDSF